MRWMPAGWDGPRKGPLDLNRESAQTIRGGRRKPQKSHKAGSSRVHRPRIRSAEGYLCPSIGWTSWHIVGRHGSGAKWKNLGCGTAFRRAVPEMRVLAPARLVLAQIWIRKKTGDLISHVAHTEGETQRRHKDTETHRVIQKWYHGGSRTTIPPFHPSRPVHIHPKLNSKGRPSSTRPSPLNRWNQPAGPRPFCSTEWGPHTHTHTYPPSKSNRC
ncbi:hypothetical protein B0T17DRAFT_515384 [Bombardia bombarda]|uniref:Uncharacterized protein n=1 Tax=Bombardia bombarda TaxID=252184 RepID=A0AA39XJK7_9PEZI|nr:hypothetical protein B0T17DRAFT_515384 [Bombardia bombarda]